MYFDYTGYGSEVRRHGKREEVPSVPLKPVGAVVEVVYKNVHEAYTPIALTTIKDIEPKVIDRQSKLHKDVLCVPVWIPII